MQNIISKPKETPKTTLGWWAFGLSVSSIFSGPLLGTFAGMVRPMLDRLFGEAVGATVGFLTGIIILSIVVAAFVTSLLAFKKGERSWAVLIGLVLGTVALAFWLFMFVGEFFFSH